MNEANNHVFDTTTGEEQHLSKRNGSSNGTSKNGVANKIPSISEIKAAIPNHCFKSTIKQSMYYVFKDIILIIALYCFGHWVLQCNSIILKTALSPVYWFLQGTLLFAVFVLGHDCNHGSFSSYALLNDCLGTVLHSFVMTPYYPWKISHRHHHNNTGNMDKDEIFYPIRKKDNNKNSFALFFGLGFGWLAYLWRGFGPRQMNHWIPRHAIFAKHVVGCILSIGVVGIWVGILGYYVQLMGMVSLVYHYMIPVFICGCYIVMVTFLHHSDINLPWYSDDNWDSVKGKLSSVDRDYGIFHDVIHTIGTHQVHHLFPIIPHYNLREATTHFRKAFPQLVHINDKSIFPAFTEMFFKYSSQCIVENDAKIHYYK
ncbi:hypothetical protein LOTGIDRAFT_116269 [Lottia gigantea]|uniref:Fatty acid desaturase domain-containing protein n=1 Tax=Lottia gigantea TaxID=225164 RepID=V4AR69_LOTGI|nr:hypothetical protein LOTGIDRAFT_116269 [Lottia gigantea]ESO96191.1 hypothetical protein LOTGIDRAFT_116269 [Lottia gigantea]